MADTKSDAPVEAPAPEPVGAATPPGSVEPDPSPGKKPSPGPLALERWLLRRFDQAGSAATAMLCLSAFLLLLSIVWLFTYDRVIQVNARSEIATLTVSKGDPLLWPLPGARTDCDAKASEPLPEDQAIELHDGLTVRIAADLRQPEKGKSQPFWQFSVAASGKSDTKASASKLNVLDASGRAIRQLELPQLICLELPEAGAASGTSIGLAVRGVITLGANARRNPTPDQLLLEGDVQLSESSQLRRIFGSFQYQVDHDRVPLQTGDLLTMHSTGGCAPDAESCIETQGFLRLIRPEDGKPLLMHARVVTTSDSVDLRRAFRPVQKIQGTFFKRIGSDPWLGLLFSAAVFFGGLGWALIERLSDLRSWQASQP